MVEVGRSMRQVAAIFGCIPMTIHNLMQRYQNHGSVNDRPRPGQPRVTTPQQDRQIRLAHLRNRFRPATVTAQTTPGRNNPWISVSTVRRRLHRSGLYARTLLWGQVEEIDLIGAGGMFIGVNGVGTQYFLPMNHDFVSQVLMVEKEYGEDAMSVMLRHASDNTIDGVGRL